MFALPEPSVHVHERFAATPSITLNSPMAGNTVSSSSEVVALPELSVHVHETYAQLLDPEEVLSYGGSPDIGSAFENIGSGNGMSYFSRFFGLVN